MGNSGREEWAKIDQWEKGQRFRQLHRAQDTMVLPTAWDVITARIYESIGFSAIGTTSAGIAATLGYPDGERIPVSEMVAAVERIAKSVDIPVSADVESGYGRTVGETVENVERFIAAGAVGINIEDTVARLGNRPEEPDRQAEKIEAIRERSAQLRQPFVINARIDSLHQGTGDVEMRLADTFSRAQLYRKAGADCIFVFGHHDKAMISRIRGGIEGPLNILVDASAPTLQELAVLGVTRVSLGPGVMKATLGLVKRIAEELRHNGTYTMLNDVSMSYQEMFGYLEGTLQCDE